MLYKNKLVGASFSKVVKTDTISLQTLKRMFFLRKRAEQKHLPIVRLDKLKLQLYRSWKLSKNNSVMVKLNLTCYLLIVIY